MDSPVLIEEHKSPVTWPWEPVISSLASSFWGRESDSQLPKLPLLLALVFLGFGVLPPTRQGEQRDIFPPKVDDGVLRFHEGYEKGGVPCLKWGWGERAD